VIAIGQRLELAVMRGLLQGSCPAAMRLIEVALQ
jgi:hypothetical protein